jgi:hypothetical protein
MRETNSTRLPFVRPLAPEDCPTCGARPLSGLPAADAVDRLARFVRDAETSRGDVATLDLADARVILDAARRGIRPVRP